jgi:hypothetical protein
LNTTRKSHIILHKKDKGFHCFENIEERFSNTLPSDLFVFRSKDILQGLSQTNENLYGIVSSSCRKVMIAMPDFNSTTVRFTSDGF